MKCYALYYGAVILTDPNVPSWHYKSVNLRNTWLKGSPGAAAAFLSGESYLGHILGREIVLCWGDRQRWGLTFGLFSVTGIVNAHSLQKYTFPFQFWAALLLQRSATDRAWLALHKALGGVRGIFLQGAILKACLCGHSVSWYGSPPFQQQFTPILPLSSTVPSPALNASHNAAQDTISLLAYRGTLPLNWLVLILMFTKNPRASSAKLLSSHSAPAFPGAWGCSSPAAGLDRLG